MHIEEAKWLSVVLNDNLSSLSPLLNLGSSTKTYRSIYQSFIDDLIFNPLENKAVKVLHSDLKEDEGVDLIGDITFSEFRSEVKSYQPQSVLCSNLLEHVIDRESMASSIMDVLPVKGLVYITVPYKYPKHMDPIDTMFRPSPEELKFLFKNTEIIASEIISVGSVFSSVIKSPFELVRMIARSFIPFYKYDGWLTTINKLGWMFRCREVTCVVLRKIDSK